MLYAAQLLLAAIRRSRDSTARREASTASSYILPDVTGHRERNLMHVRFFSGNDAESERYFEGATIAIETNGKDRRHGKQQSV